MNGPGWIVATFDRRGSGAFSGDSGHGMRTLGCTTIARSFSMPSASTVGPASMPRTFTTAQPCASPSGRSIGVERRWCASTMVGPRSYEKPVSLPSSCFLIFSRMPATASANLIVVDVDVTPTSTDWSFAT